MRARVCCITRRSSAAIWTDAFVDRLHELGWVEGHTVAIEYGWAEGSRERMATIASQFVRVGVDIILA
jgi:putative ABC transport system substrate-binding protein